MLRRLISENITLTTNLAPDLRFVKVDAGQFEHVVLNLALNARDAMAHGGHLTIETRNVDLDGSYVSRHTGAMSGPHVMLSVTDTGHGMTPEVKSRIFEPFFTTKGVGEGTGLGLAMVYGTVKQSGGSIWVYSEVDRGTTFKIYLPQMEGDAVQIGIPAIKSPKELRGTETILLVEDEEVVRTLARTILAQQGYNVLEAANPDEAMLFSQRYGGTIHLLLTDVIMPKASGQQLAERLRSNRPDLKILYMSGYTDDVIVDDELGDPERAFLEKPYSAEELASKVRALLDVR
jgi:CheY-like chemotaxis protein